MEENGLITTLVAAIVLAFVLGFIAQRLKLSPLVGYLLAGVAAGPHSPGFTADIHLALQLSEVGVILLMFGVGLHFHFDDLMAVRGIAIPGALGQSFIATLCGLGIAVLVGWNVTGGTVLGIAVSVASTVVLLRVLMDHGLVETAEGRAAVGWLVVEDIITVLVLVLLPALGAQQPGADGDAASSLWVTAGIAMLKLVIFGGVMAFVGARFVPWLLLRVARLRSRELFTLTVLVIAMAVATLGFVSFGASMALGAFLAGMVVAQSKLSHQAAADALPMRDAFAVLFFVSVGMLFDVRQLLTAPWVVAGLLVVVLVVKPVTAMLIVLATGHTFRTGLVVAGGLAQIGEFSFILAEAARAVNLMPEAGHHALVACAIISISLNPWLFKRMIELEPWLQRHPRLFALVNRRVQAHGLEANRVGALQRGGATIDAIIVGYGPVGRTLARRASEFGLQWLVIDTNVDTVLTLQAEGKHALYGDASHPEILKEAGVRNASYLIISLPDSAVSVGVLTAARSLNPKIKVMARIRYLAQGGVLEQAGADVVCYDEAEAATALSVVLRAHVKANAAAGEPREKQSE